MINRFVPIVAALLLLPAGAQAAVVAEVRPSAGPLLDDGNVTWGEERGGEAVVLTGAPGVAPVERARLPAVRRARTTRGFSGYPSAFAVSPFWLAFVSHTSTIVDDEGDDQGSISSQALWTSAAGGPLRGRSKDVFVRSVDVDGPVLAWAEEVFPPSRRADRLRQRVIVQEGPRRRTFGLPTRGRGDVGPVRVAGRYVAWRQKTPEQLVVADHRSGRIVLRLRRGGAIRAFGGFDLRDDGTVAVGLSRGADLPSDLAVASPATPTPRVIASNPTAVAMAGDRVVFGVSDRELYEEKSVAIVPVAGGQPRTVVAFPPDRLRVGTLSFDGRRLAYGEADSPIISDIDEDTPMRIHVIDVP